MKRIGILTGGGTPTPFDRWLATRYDAAGVRPADDSVITAGLMSISFGDE